MSALVTPGNLRSALAVTRSLGRAGVAVTVADEHRYSLAGTSRYCRDAVRVPSPAQSPDAFLEAIQREVERGKHRVLIPTDDIALSLISEARSRFEGLAVLPFPDAEIVQLAHDKGALMSLADEKGIPAPRTVVVREPADVERAIRSVGFPAVVKARISRLVVGGQWRSAPGTHYVHNRAELEMACRAVAETVPFPLVQEYVPGDGRGVFALMNRGRLRAAFAHRRLREKPPSGGVSVLSESIALDPQMLEQAERILEALKWHGVAMVEFKRDARDGVAKLLEINGRFWGSLQLSVDAGVDFPYLLYQLALAGDVEPVSSYATGVRLRWWLGDVDWLLLRLREPDRLRALREFLTPAGRLARGEILRRDDPAPAVVELSQYLAAALRGATGGERGEVALRRHGAPRCLHLRRPSMSRPVQARRVIVLDGERPASLTIVRSLGRRGIEVIVGSSRQGALSARSRYASRAFVYPHPVIEPARFRKALLDNILDDGVELTIPVSDTTCASLAAGRDDFAGQSRLAVSSDEALAVVLSRASTRGLASRLGIPAVAGTQVRSVREGLEAARETGFPLVVAPDNRVSRAVLTRAGGAQYVTNQADLVRALNSIVRLGAAHLGPPLEDEGIGLAVLCRRGSVLWAFQYRNLHELGPGDAVSAYRISERVDPALLAQAQAMMRELSWDGAAELQFRSSGARCQLTSVGAVFADVLPLAVAAGANAPNFLYDLEVHDRRDFGEYRVGTRCRHLPSEVAWARELFRPKTARVMPFRRPAPLGVLADMARALSPREHWDTQRIDDPWPGVLELREVSADMWQSVIYRLARIRERRRMRRAARRPDEIAARVLAARTILFVCLGNIIRSAFAAGLLGVHSNGELNLRIRSAGLAAATDHRADPTAVQCARRFGVDLSAHRTRRIDQSAIEEADILLAMELDHVVEICRLFPQYRHKVYLLGCLTDESARDVADPVNAPADVFDACFDRIDRGIRRLMEMRNPSTQPINMTRGIRSEGGIW